jgi:hypothetical protein
MQTGVGKRVAKLDVVPGTVALASTPADADSRSASDRANEQRVAAINAAREAAALRWERDLETLVIRRVTK